MFKKLVVCISSFFPFSDLFALDTFNDRKRYRETYVVDGTNMEVL